MNPSCSCSRLQKQSHRDSWNISPLGVRSSLCCLEFIRYVSKWIIHAWNKSTSIVVNNTSAHQYLFLLSFQAHSRLDCPAFCGWMGLCNWFRLNGVWAEGTPITSGLKHWSVEEQMRHPVPYLLRRPQESCVPDVAATASGASIILDPCVNDGENFPNSHTPSPQLAMDI